MKSTVLVALLLLIGCGRTQVAPIQKTLVDGPLAATVKIDRIDTQNNFLYSYLIVRNTSNSTVSYSNKYLVATYPSGNKAHAYVNTNASMLVDVGNVDILPHDSLSLDIYFPFDQNAKVDDFSKVQLSLYVERNK